MAALGRFVGIVPLALTAASSSEVRCLWISPAPSPAPPVPAILGPMLCGFFLLYYVGTVSTLYLLLDSAHFVIRSGWVSSRLDWPSSILVGLLHWSQGDQILAVQRFSRRAHPAGSLSGSPRTCLRTGRAHADSLEPHTSLLGVREG